ALVITVLTYFGAQALAAMVLVAAAAAGIIGTNLQATTAGQFFFVFISDAIILLAIWAFLRGKKNVLKYLGFGRRPSWGDATMASVGYLVYFAVLFVVTLVAAFFAGL